MTRQKREAESRSQVLRVREYCGTYIATGGGKRTTCTQGAIQAAHSHASKLFVDRNFTLTPLAEPNAWRATAQEAV